MFLSAVGVSGRERTFLALAERLAGRGVRVEVVTVRPTADLRCAIPDGVGLVDLERWWSRLPGLGSTNKRRIYLSVPALVGYLQRSRPDVMLSTSIPPNLTALRAIARSGVGTPLVLRQSNVVHIPGSPGYQSVRPRLRDRFIPRWYPLATAIVAVSEGVAENLLELVDFPRDRIHTIPNWNVPPELARMAQEPVDHPWLAESQEGPVLVAVGRLVAKKDYPTLLRAFARVRAALPARLIVLGRDGGERERIEAFARELGLPDHVDFVGHRANPFAYLSRADCFVLSSVSEGMPNALVEALACGCPVVSTDCASGPAEILEHGAHGRLVPVGDDRSLAAAIEATLAAPPEREKLRARGAQFAQERAVDRYVDVLETAARLGDFSRHPGH